MSTPKQPSFANKIVEQLRQCHHMQNTHDQFATEIVQIDQKLKQLSNEPGHNKSKVIHALAQGPLIEQHLCRQHVQVNFDATAQSVESHVRNNGHATPTEIAVTAIKARETMRAAAAALLGIKHPNTYTSELLTSGNAATSIPFVPKLPCLPFAFCSPDYIWNDGTKMKTLEEIYAQEISDNQKTTRSSPRTVDKFTPRPSSRTTTRPNSRTGRRGSPRTHENKRLKLESNLHNKYKIIRKLVVPSHKTHNPEPFINLIQQHVAAETLRSGVSAFAIGQTTFKRTSLSAVYSYWDFQQQSIIVGSTPVQPLPHFIATKLGILTHSEQQMGLQHLLNANLNIPNLPQDITDKNAQPCVVSLHYYPTGKQRRPPSSQFAKWADPNTPTFIAFFTANPRTQQDEQNWRGTRVNVAGERRIVLVDKSLALAPDEHELEQFVEIIGDGDFVYQAPGTQLTHFTALTADERIGCENNSNGAALELCIQWAHRQWAGSLFQTRQ